MRSTGVLDGVGRSLSSMLPRRNTEPLERCDAARGGEPSAAETASGGRSDAL